MKSRTFGITRPLLFVLGLANSPRVFFTMNIRSRRFRLLLALSCLVLEDGFLPDIVHAETRTAAALTPEAVWEAIDAAKDGDTVQLPVGTANWSKGWNTGRGAKMKAITIQGAGMDKTIICDHRGQKGGGVPFELQGVEGKPFRITGITFDGAGWPDAGLWGGFISISGTCKNFRIDHCKFKNACVMMPINASGSHDETYGLIDHCNFDDNIFSAIGLKQGEPQGFIFINAGIGIVFNNTVTGTTYNTRTIQLTHERSFCDRGGFGVCDGTSPVDGNQIPAGQKGAGYPAMGQPGRGTDADGDGVFEPSPCYAWNNTLNGVKLNMALRRWGSKETELQAEHVKEGRDFFNQESPAGYYKPYVYPHTLQEGWEALMKSIATSAVSTGGSMKPSAATKP